MYFILNEIKIDGSCLIIDDKGIMVSGIIKSYFDMIIKMEYNVLYNNFVGLY